MRRGARVAAVCQVGNAGVANAAVFANLPGLTTANVDVQYLDVNGNGIQDGGEPNLTNVTVYVTDSTNGTHTVTTDANGNFIGTSTDPIDPLLGPLQDNGGPTFTHALLAGSPALDAGDPASTLTVDGTFRINGGRFVFNYNLHSIPTIRFEVWFGGKSLIYYLPLTIAERKGYFKAEGLDAQKIGGAITYIRRQSIQTACGISVDLDDDGHGDSAAN